MSFFAVRRRESGVFVCALFCLFCKNCGNRLPRTTRYGIICVILLRYYTLWAAERFFRGKGDRGTYEQTLRRGGHHRSRRVGGRAPAPRHVYRHDEQQGAAPHSVGDRRQRHRRGRQRLCGPHRRRPSQGRQRLRARQRPRHPHRHPPQDQGFGRAGRLYAAARGRQVRRAQLFLLGRPARRGRVRYQRPFQVAESRSVPRRVRLAHGVPFLLRSKEEEMGVGHSRRAPRKDQGAHQKARFVRALSAR